MYAESFSRDLVAKEFDERFNNPSGTNGIKGDVANMLSYSELSIPFQNNTEIVGGTIEVLVNGSISKRLHIPAQHVDWTGFIKNPGMTIATNK